MTRWPRAPRWVALLAGALLLGGCSRPEGGWFREVATERGLEFRHQSGHADEFLFPEIIGGGVALFDMDGDGDLDVYLVQSGSLPLPGAEASRNRLFVNRGDGQFEDVTDGSGADDTGYGMGVAAGDYDNDGKVDLYVTNYGPDVLLRNEGGGRFSDVTVAAGIDSPSWGTSAAFVDYNHDGFLDIFVVNYVNWTQAVELQCYNPAGARDYCLPTNYNAPAMDRLFENRGDGTFDDVTLDRGVHAAFGNGLGVVASDFDGDAQIDIFVTNDTMLNQLWINQGLLGFEDQALLRGTAVDEHGTAKAGMGVAAADVDDDGDFDLLVVNLESQSDSFFRNDSGFFEDETGTVGLTGASRQFTRFGVGLVDFDNDGVLDLYQANGRVVASPEPPTEDAYAEPNLLLRGDGAGRFTEVLPRGGTAEPLIHVSRGAAFGDVDNDGGVDVVVVNRDGPAYLLLNTVRGRGNWVRLRLVDGNGRDALGATVRAQVGERQLTRQVRPASSYCSSSDPRVHFGIGAARSIDGVRVRWPDGTTERFGPFEASDDYTLRQGQGTPQE